MSSLERRQYERRRPKPNHKPATVQTRYAVHMAKQAVSGDDWTEKLTAAVCFDYAVSAGIVFG